MTVTRRLAEFVSALSFDRLPAEAVAAAKLGIADTIAVTLAARDEPAGEKISRFVQSQGGNPVATVLGRGFRTSPTWAALANGTLGHALDYDDLNPVMAGHPSVPLVPAALALAEANGVSGRELIAAYVAGFEVECRISRGVNPALQVKGFHSTGLLGTIGAAAAAARVLGLDADRTAAALAIAASQSAGIQQNFGTMTKPFHVGHSAQAGVTAALLAADGFTADAQAIEGTKGFAQVYSSAGEPNFDVMLAGLGETLEVCSPDSGVTIKKYACCGCTHTALDAMLDLINAHDLRPDQIDRVDVGGSKIYPGILTHHEPKTGLEGKFSMEYAMAVALLERTAGIAQFVDEKVSAAPARDLMRRVTLDIHPDFAQDETFLPAEVAVTLKDGRRLVRRLDRMRGMPDNPLTWADLSTKYRECAAFALDAAAAERSLDLLSHLETLGNVTELTGSVAGAPHGVTPAGVR